MNLPVPAFVFCIALILDGSTGLRWMSRPKLRPLQRHGNGAL